MLSSYYLFIYILTMQTHRQTVLPFVTVRPYQYVLSQAFVELDNINYIKDSVSFIYIYCSTGQMPVVL